MADAIDTSERLPVARVVSRALVHLDAAEDPACQLFAAALRRWFEGDLPEGCEYTRDRLAACLGVADTWRDGPKREARDAALRAMASTLHRSSRRETAKAIAMAVLRYESTQYIADRAVGRRPPELNGLAYDYLRADGPRSWEMIRQLLRG